MIRTNIHLALTSIRAAKLRTFLTIVAVIFGIWSFTVVTTTVDGLRDAAANEIGALGGNLVQVLPGNVITEDEEGNRQFNPIAAFGASTITSKDVADIRKLDDVKSLAPIGLVSAQISRGDKVMQNASVIATSTDYPATFSQEVESGTFLNNKGSLGNFVVVGQGVVDELFGGELALGTKITIRGSDFTVVGAMQEYESALSMAGAPNLNDAAFITLEDAQEISQGLVSIQEVDIQLEESADAAAFKQEVTELLLENHNGETDFTVLTQDEIIELTDSLFGIIKQAGQYLSAVMLFVSSIVILLIMLITVRERTREIGIRKSIGATNGNIMIQFLSEALVISWLGSLVGIVLGLITGGVVKAQTDITPSYTMRTFVTLFVISSLVGILAGVVPAWLAARKDPVESLRHE